MANLRDKIKDLAIRIGQEFSDVYSDISGKADKSNTYTKSEVDAKLSSVYKPMGSVPTYGDLPTSGNEIGHVYNVESDGVNYAWVGGTDGEQGDGWDSLSGIVDLSDYATEDWANGKFEPKFSKKTAFNKNFGTSSGMVAEGDDSRFHTHSNKSVLDATEEAYTSSDKSKLDGIEAGANNYVHPTSAGNKHIPSGGGTDEVLQYAGSSGTAKWAKLEDTQIESNANFVSDFEGELP